MSQSTSFSQTTLGQGEQSPLVSLVLAGLPYLLVFMSGACALIYEVIWSRMLVLVMGNTTLAATTILAAFMAGLALGYYFWGRFIGLAPDLSLIIFAAMEIGIGLFALISPWLTGMAAVMDGWITSSVDLSYWSQAGLKFIICFMGLLIPTFLMGGTLPVLGERLIEQQEQFGWKTALIYGLNITGGVLGAVLAGFHLISLLGHSSAVRLTALVNILVGLAAAGAYRWSRQGRGYRYSLTSSSSQYGLARLSPRAGTLTLLVLGLSGFSALAHEVFWTRFLILVVDNSIYSFTMILLAVLVGLALGSLALAPILRVTVGPLVGLTIVQAGMAIGAMAFPYFVQATSSPPETPYWIHLLTRLPTVILVPTVMMGATVPLASEIYQARHSQIGHSLGTTLAINTLGGIIGCVLTSFYFIPALGLQKTWLILPAVSLLAFGLLFTTWLRGWPAIITVFLCTFAVYPAGRLLPTDMFVNKYSSLEPGSRLTYYHDGLAATACVFTRPNLTKSLYINGTPELDTSRLSIKTFKLMSLLPQLLHPRPERVLMVTFGAGITSGAASVSAKQVESVDLLEDYKGIAAQFQTANNDIVNRPHFTMYVDDARHFLRSRSVNYPIIVSDSTHPRSHDSWVLYTREFYQSVKRRLTPEGIFCQWVPFHGLHPNQHTAILNTFSLVFPHTSVWSVGEAYLLLVATPEKLSIDFSAWEAKLAQEALRQDMAPLGLADPIKVLGHFLMGEDRLRTLTESSATVITDDGPAHLFFPYKATLADQYEKWPQINFERLRTAREPVTAYVTNLGRSAEENAALRQAINKSGLDRN